MFVIQRLQVFIMAALLLSGIPYETGALIDENNAHLIITSNNSNLSYFSGLMAQLFIFQVGMGDTF